MCRRAGEIAGDGGSMSEVARGNVGSEEVEVRQAEGLHVVSGPRFRSFWTQDGSFAKE